MPALFFDCSSGISGDMTVAALLDLGVSPDAFAAELEKLGLSPEFHTHVSQQSRQMIAGTKFDVHLTFDPSSPSDHSGHAHHTHSRNEDGHSHSEPHSHADSHQHTHSDGDHSHGRSYREIRELIEASPLSDRVRRDSLAVFHRIAVAEGRIHGCAPEDVGFHEVGAVDSIVDIVGSCICLELLGNPEIYCSHLFDGIGSIQCAHGTFPLPAPATLEILKGIPLRQIDEPMEFITPTGAALMAEFSRGFGPLPLMQIEKIGYGLGTRDTSPRPNVLRVVMGTTLTEGADPESETITEIVTNIDDTTPEIAGTFPATLLELGALDAFLTPVQMKKNRPGLQLTVLTEKSDADRIAAWILTHTSTFGVRIHDCRRMTLERKLERVATAFGDVLVKFGYLNGRCVRASPEFESFAAAARDHGVPIEQVYHAALHAGAQVRNSQGSRGPEQFTSVDT